MTSCTQSADPAYDSLVSRLKNKGMVALSPENPYIASNLLIAKELNLNPELRGFTDHKGVPNLIEVNKEYFKPLKYKFYYPNEQSYYNLELVNKTWVISGPETINAVEAQKIYYLTGGNILSPKIILGNSEYQNGPQNQNSAFDAQNANNNFQNLNDGNFAQNATNQNNVPSIVKTPIVPPKASQNAQKGGYQGAINKPVSQVQKNNNTTTSNSNDSALLDRIIQNTSTYTAEQNYQGDLIHYVSYQGESLSLISRWYTKDPSNADKIARINSKNAKDNLQIGDKIVIPSYLVKNKNKLTQKALQDMISVFNPRPTINNNINTNQNISYSYSKPTTYQGATPPQSNSPQGNNKVNSMPQNSMPVNNQASGTQNMNSITLPKGVDSSELEFF